MDEREHLRREAAGLPGVDLLVLFGSRARGEAGPGSDWDLAYEGSADPLDLSARLSRIVGTDRVDLVDLNRAGALLRFRIARDGMPLRDDAARFRAFQADAALVWCDMGPVIEAAYRDALESL